MSKNPDKRKCSAVCSNRRPCKAWAVIESDPPLCAVHAGLNVGKGAKEGNGNAVKHGLYIGIIKADEIAAMEMVTSTSLLHELVLVRIGLRRLSKFLEEDGLPLADVLAILPVMSTMVRTVA